MSTEAECVIMHGREFFFSPDRRSQWVKKLGEAAIYPNERWARIAYNRHKLGYQDATIHPLSAGGVVGEALPQEAAR